MTTMTTAAGLARRERTLEEVVVSDLSPLARRIDEEGLYPESTMRALGIAGAFGYHANGRGPGAGVPTAAAAMARIGEVCGATAFCTWCQDALVWYLTASENAALRDRLLQRAASGTQLGGTGLSNPMKAFSGFGTLALKGERIAGGWRVRGRLPWVSNLGPDFLFAAIFEAEGRSVMAIFSCAQEGVTLADSGRFIALEGTRTYAVLVRDAVISDDMVLSDDADVFVPKIRQGFVLLQMGMALGVARAAAAQMRVDARAQKVLADLPLDANRIEARADELEAASANRCAELWDCSRQAFLETLRVRLQGSQLALEAAQANLIAHGARGYLRGSQPERLHREAHFVAIVSPSVKHILTELQRG